MYRCASSWLDKGYGMKIWIEYTSHRSVYYVLDAYLDLEKTWVLEKKQDS